MGTQISINDKLAKVTTWIQDYFQQKKIVDVSVNNIEKYMDVSHEELSKMNPDAIGEIAVMLAKHAYFVQKLHNEEHSKHKWVNHELKRYIIPKFANYNCSYKSYDEKEHMVINDDEYAGQLNKLRSVIDCRLTSLSDLAMRIQFMAQTLLQLQQSKRQYIR